MEKYNIIKIREHEELIEQAADWFHQKWNIPRRPISKAWRIA